MIDETERPDESEKDPVATPESEITGEEAGPDAGVPPEAGAADAAAPGEPEPPAEQPVAEEPAAEEPAAEEPAAEEPAAEEPAVEEPAAEEPAAEEPAAEPVAEEPAPEPAAEEPAPEAPAAAEPAAAGEAAAPDQGPSADAPPAADEQPAAAQRPPSRGAKPKGDEAVAIPGADLVPDIVPEGSDPLGRGLVEDEYGAVVEVDVEGEEATADGEQPAESQEQAIPQAAIDLAAGATYTATGKRKTAVARVILRPGTGAYTVNGRTLNEFFPRDTLQRNIRLPLETVGYESRMDVVARLHGGGVSAQAGALRHGISRALLEADPNLRGELKRRGFLTRDARAKERKKAGLKKARKRPQFSKR